MLFNSKEFILFLPFVIIVYYLIPHRFRWAMLLIVSYYFYMCWKAEYIILILISTIIDYISAILISKQPEKKKKQNYLMVSIFLNLGFLFTFKYLNFVTASINDVLSYFKATGEIPYSQILLPVGISFYTFQSLSYTIDVYNNKIKPEKHFGIFALYVSYWPQLVAGPIERASTLLPQFSEKKTFNYDNFVWGLNKIALGFFKKLVVADRLAPYVENVFGVFFSQSDSLSLLIAVFFFSIQIYCDFSGYSDIAIGSAKLMGYDLMENFKRPYLSKSISEFWKRWHISLSSWFKDYVYIPLGGNRTIKWRWYYNLFITFLISGLWHGANWTFIIWGALHGFYLVSAIAFAPILKKITAKFSILNTAFINILVTYILVLFAWIFFRAENLSHAILFIKKIFDFSFSWNILVISGFKGAFNLFLSFFAIFLLALSYLLPENLKIKYNLTFLIITTILIILLGVNGNAEFIYFQF